MNVQLLDSAFAAVVKFAKTVQRHLQCAIFNSKSPRQIVIETNGDAFAAWSNSKTNSTLSPLRIEPRPLTSEALAQNLSELNYGGQPVTLVLHPPCVCVKTFHLATDNPGQWLASNLAEIAPPGNRRDQVLSYKYCLSDELLIAFARTSSLALLREILSECKIAVGQVLTGGTAAFDSLLLTSERPCDSRLDFALCSYNISIQSDGVQIVPEMNREVSNLRSGNLPQLNEITRRNQQIDFRSHLGLPKALPTLHLQRTIKLECAMLAVAFFLFLLDLGARSVEGTAASDRQYSATVCELDSIRKVNTLLRTQLESATKSQYSRSTVCDFLNAVALTTPSQSWLEKISFSSSNSNEVSNFNVSGFSFSEDDPLRFIDSLRTKRQMRSVTLSKGSIVANDPGTGRNSAPSDRLTRFVVTGQYAKQ